MLWRPLILSLTMIGILTPVPALSQAGMPAPVVGVSAPLVKRISQWDEYTGRFEAYDQVEVRPRVSGFVGAVHFKDGQLVNKDDLLFTIDPRPYQLAVEASKAEVARAQAQVDLAMTEVERAEPLMKQRVVTERDFDQRKANLSMARAGQAAAEAAHSTAQLNLEWTQVRAPISGRISDSRIDVGNLVSGGQTGATLLTTIVTLDPIHFVFDVSEADFLRYSRLHKNGERQSSRETANPVQVRLADEKDWLHDGTMDFVDNQLNARSGTIRGRAAFDNKDQFLIPGVFGRLRLWGGDVDALLIPDSSIVSDQAARIVLVVGPENKLMPKPVQLGQMVDGLRVVRSGLSPEDKVVISGLANPFVRPGVVVNPQPGEIKPTQPPAH